MWCDEDCELCLAEGVKVHPVDVLLASEPNCPNCVGVTVMDGRPMYCESCGAGIKQAPSDAAPGGAG